MKTMDINGRNVLIFSDKNSISRYFIRQLNFICTVAAGKRGSCAIAISGGRTPVFLYEAIALEESIDWSGIHIFFVDERFVPRESPQSNYRLIKDHLLRPGGVPPSQVHPVPLIYNAESSALLYENEIREFFNLKKGEIPRLDIVLLGMGSDGHIASIFRNDNPVFEEEYRIAKATFGGGLERVTLTLDTINKASNVFFLVLGSEKAEVVKDVLSGDDKTLPAACVNPETNKPIFILDREAAALLSAVSII